MTDGITITFGRGNSNPQGWTLDIDPATASVTLARAIERHTGVEAWVSFSSFTDNYRKKDNWLRSTVIGVDLDWYDADGKHSALPEGTRQNLDAAFRTKTAPGNVAHTSPRGARIIYVLGRTVERREDWMKIALFLIRLTQSRLAELGLAVPDGDSPKGGLSVDRPATSDCSRFYYTPRASVDGFERNGEIFVLSKEPLYVDDLLAPAVESSPPKTDKPVNGTNGTIRNPGAYAKAALERAAQEVKGAKEGSRNNTLNDQAFSLSKLIRLGYINRKSVEDELQTAGEQAGLKPEETRRTIASGLGDAKEPAEKPGPSTDSDDDRILLRDDPIDITQKLLGRLRDDEDNILLRTWRDEWWRYESGTYRNWPRQQFRGEVWDLIAELFVPADGGGTKRLKTSKDKVSNVEDSLSRPSLKVLIPSKLSPPFYIEGMESLSKNVTVCKNGVLNLETGFLAPLTPNLFSTTCVDAAWDPNASPRPPRWTRFLEDVFDDDYQAVDLLQEWFGYCLTTDTSQQKMLILLGQKRSGKGTIARVLSSLLGEDAVIWPKTSSLEDGFALQPFIGKSLAVFSDVRISSKTDYAPILEHMLSITGEDAQTINRKNKSHVTVRLQSRIMMLSNELPRFTDSSGAFASRCLIIDIKKSFFGAEDTELEEALKEEKQGILKWAVDGWRSLKERGRFKSPSSSEDVVDDFEELTSPIRGFIQELCVIDSNEWIDVQLLYDAWASWAKRNNLDPGSVQTFAKNLRSAVRLRTTRTRSEAGFSRKFIGISLVS